VEQVTVGGVDLGDPEAGVAGAFGGGDERLPQFLDLVRLQFARRGRLRRRLLVLVPLVVRPRLAARPDRLPAAVALVDRRRPLPGSRLRRLPTGVGQLDRRHAPLLGDELGDRRERLGVLVRPDAQILGGDPSPRLDGGRLGHHDPCAADGAAPEVDTVPLRGQPVSVLTGVLAHRRQHHPVRYLRVPQLQSREEVLGHRPTVRPGGKSACRSRRALPVRSGAGKPGRRA